MRGKNSYYDLIPPLVCSSFNLRDSVTYADNINGRQAVVTNRVIYGGEYFSVIFTLRCRIICFHFEGQDVLKVHINYYLNSSKEILLAKLGKMEKLFTKRQKLINFHCVFVTARV